MRWDDDVAITHDPLHMLMKLLIISPPIMPVCTHLITGERLGRFS
jgi:hypothetical protein